MTNSEKNKTDGSALQTDLKAEQALGLIGLGLMQKMVKEGTTADWNWLKEETQENADLIALRQRLELTALAIETAAPLTTAEVSQLLGAKPGSAQTQRGGLLAKRISRNVWKLSRSEKESNYWRN